LKFNKKIKNRKSRKHSWMNIPILLRTNSKKYYKKIINTFNKNGIETRAIIAGNIVNHPATKKIDYRVDKSLKIANKIFNQGFMIGCSPNLSSSALDLLTKTLNKCSKISQ
jgi:dTDP-4-amino-4,6-dideoxygalactose transaminase